jgi:hypothetical protein
MSEITRAEFDALVQKVEEIHRMLKNMQPSVVPLASTSEQRLELFGGGPDAGHWGYRGYPTFGKTTGGTNERT